MKYYYGFFRDNNTTNDPDGQLYKVVIRVNDGDTAKMVQEELLLADSPFVVEYDSDKEVFKPYRCSTATVRMLNKDFNPDFNAVDARDVEVDLLKLKPTEVWNENLVTDDTKYWDLEWTGYATPNAYAQGYNSFLDEFELECQDRLSVLRYIDASLFAIGPIYSLKQYIFWFTASAGLKSVYFTDNIRIPDVLRSIASEIKDVNPILEKSGIGDILKDNSNKKRKALDVLYDICKILNITVLQIRDALYFVSYDAIAHGYCSYSLIPVGTGEEGRQLWIEEKHEISKDESAANSTSLSLETVYCDFSVVASHISNDDCEFPDLSDWNIRKEGIYTDPEGTTISGLAFSNIKYRSFTKASGAISTEETRIHILNTNRTDPMDQLRCIVWYNFFGIEESVYDDPRIVKIDCKAFYEDGTPDPLYRIGNATLLTQYVITSPYNAVFATPVRYGIWEGNSYDAQRERPQHQTPSYKYGYKIFHDTKNEPYPVSEVYLNNAQSERVNRIMHKTLSFSKSVVFGKDKGVLFNASFTFDPDMFGFQYDEGYVRLDKKLCFNWLLISFSYFTSDGMEKTIYYGQDDNGGVDKWQSDMRAVKMYFDVSNVEFGDDGVSTDNSNSFGTAYYPGTNIPKKFKKDNNTKGFFIPSPTDGEAVLDGTLTITICRPWGLTHRKTVSTFIENPSIDILTYHESVVSEDEDTRYSVSSGKRGEEYEEDVNVVSYDGKMGCSNYLYRIDYNKDAEKIMRYLDYIQNLCSGEVLRPEELLLSSYRRQYSTNTISLTVPTHSEVGMLGRVTWNRFKNKSFVVVGTETDYRYNKRTLTLIEKK